MSLLFCSLGLGLRPDIGDSTHTNLRIEAEVRLYSGWDYAMPGTPALWLDGQYWGNHTKRPSHAKRFVSSFSCHCGPGQAPLPPRPCCRRLLARLEANCHLTINPATFVLQETNHQQEPQARMEARELSQGCLSSTGMVYTGAYAGLPSAAGACL